MSFNSTEVSEKGFPGGWDPDAEDQASQRVIRVTQLLEAMVFRPFSWDRFNSLNLKYAYHGGYIDTGAEWLRILDSSVTLVDGATNFIERTDVGNVVVNQTGFTYDNHIPMAQIDARNGACVQATYIDSRPEIGGAPSTGGAGQITFSQIIGQILDSQVPLSAVAQWQFDLIIQFTQILGTATRAQLPALVAYEDEANVFTVLQHFGLGIQTDTINEETLDAGVTIEGVLIKDGEIELAKRAIQLDEVGGDPLISYLGRAVPGTLTSAADWSIQRITEPADGDIFTEWADGDGDPDNIWDNRLALSYS